MQLLVSVITFSAASLWIFIASVVIAVAANMKRCVSNLPCERLGEISDFLKYVLINMVSRVERVACIRYEVWSHALSACQASALKL